MQFLEHDQSRASQSQEHNSDQRHHEANGGAATKLATRTVDAQNLSLSRESDVLRDRLVQALAIGNIQTCQVIGHVEEHVAAVVQALEAFSVVWEPIAAVCGRCVAQEDTLDLVGVVVGELGVVLHDVRVGSVGYEHELPLGEGGENLLQKEHTDGQGSTDVGEVQWSCVERAARVGLVNEVHVVASCLLRCCCQVMEVGVVW